MNENSHSKRSPFIIVKTIIILILIAVIGYEGIMIYKDQSEYSAAVNEYDNIRDTYVKVSDDKTSDNETTDDTEDSYPVLDINYDVLYEINPDFIGWLYFPAFPKINYPIVKERSIDQYLHKTFDGKANKAGCIFMDVLSDENFSGLSDMIFGHNMKNLSMFGSLKSLYKSGNEHLLDEDPFVYIYTKDKILKYRVFAYYTTTNASYSYNEVKTHEDYDAYLDYIRKNSLIEIPQDVSFDDYPSLLTLSTCSGQAGSGRRFVVHTVKVAEF
ncbi:class B sortase [Butyrivibrio sp. AE3004]|uniref:class B sortase n=1 Tax=Butyrivibrio sp. AE3004 TaxID=1506994 RepID=UPI000494AEA0|nr:class B sortase [Butyrivibrio sp. AE3004]